MCESQRSTLGLFLYPSTFICKGFLSESRASQLATLLSIKLWRSVSVCCTVPCHLRVTKACTTPISFYWCWRSQLQGTCLLGSHSIVRTVPSPWNLFILIYCDAWLSWSFILDLESPWKRVSGCVYENFHTEQGRPTLRVGVTIPWAGISEGRESQLSTQPSFPTASWLWSHSDQSTSIPTSMSCLLCLAVSLFKI